MLRNYRSTARQWLKITALPVTTISNTGTTYETRDINDDGGVPILPISFINAAADFQQVLDVNEDRSSTVQPHITDADRMDTAPTRGAVITEEVK